MDLTDLAVYFIIYQSIGGIFVYYVDSKFDLSDHRVKKEHLIFISIQLWPIFVIAIMLSFFDYLYSKVFR